MKEILAKPWARQTIAALGIGVIVAVVGPFGTFRSLDLPARLLYWVPLIALGWIQWALIDRAVSHLAELWRGGWPGPWWSRELLLCLLTPVPLIFEIVAFQRLFGLRVGASWLELYGWTAGLTLMISALVIGVIHWARAAAAETDPEGAARVDRDFVARLPAEKRGRLLCLKTEDHYLRVYTDRGEELILLRLKDALRELEGHDGRQVHRSYWVARTALAEARRDGRKTLLRLTNGLEVPVSQTYLPELKAAGWLA